VQERVRIRYGRRLTLVPRAALLPGALLDGFRRYSVLARSALALTAALSRLALPLLALARLALPLGLAALTLLTLGLTVLTLPCRALALAFALATLVLHPPALTVLPLPFGLPTLALALVSLTILLAGTALAELAGTASDDLAGTASDKPAGTAVSVEARSDGAAIEPAQALASNPLAAQFRANQHAIDDATDDGTGRDLARIDVATILGEAGVGSREKGRDGYGRDQKGFQAGPPTSMPRQ